MIGLYSPFAFLGSGPPHYEFALRLPGELVETNGTAKAGQIRWRFTGEQLFPDGYEMKAKSIFIDREGQKRVLGRLVIDDESKAMGFMELVGEDGPLNEAVRKAHQTGDLNALGQVKTRSYQENLRARKLHDMLFKR